MDLFFRTDGQSQLPSWHGVPEPWCNPAGSQTTSERCPACLPAVWHLYLPAAHSIFTIFPKKAFVHNALSGKNLDDTLTFFFHAIAAASLDTEEVSLHTYPADVADSAKKINLIMPWIICWILDGRPMIYLLNVGVSVLRFCNRVTLIQLQ